MTFRVKKRYVRAALEKLDADESPELPGFLREETFREVIKRFDEAFSRRSDRKNLVIRQEEINKTLEELRKNTPSMELMGVRVEGKVCWNTTPELYELFKVDLNPWEKIFFMIDVTEGNTTGSKAWKSIILLFITVAIFSWVLSTFSTFIDPDYDCAGEPVPGSCEPRPLPAFLLVESLCIYFFTAEYVVRLFSCHSVRFEIQEEDVITNILTGQTNDRNRDQDSLARLMMMKSCSKLRRTLLWFVQPFNLVDFFAVLPYWLEKYMLANSTSLSLLGNVRVLRVLRVFRVFRLGKYSDAFGLFARVVGDSMPVLYVLMVLVLVVSCSLGTLYWYAERGVWYPLGDPELEKVQIAGRGAWLVLDIHGETRKETDVPSIVHAMWYVLVTITTVGYGDVYPTSIWGRVVGTVTILCGVVVYATPVGVIGSNFSLEYDRREAKKKRHEKQREWEEKRRKAEMQQQEAMKASETSYMDLEEKLDSGSDAAKKQAEAKRRKALLQLINDAQALVHSLEQAVPVPSMKHIVHRFREIIAQIASPSTSSAGQRMRLDRINARILEAISEATERHTAMQKGKDLKGYDPSSVAISSLDALQLRERVWYVANEVWRFWEQFPPPEKLPPPKLSEIRDSLFQSLTNGTIGESQSAGGKKGPTPEIISSAANPPGMAATPDSGQAPRLSQVVPVVAEEPPPTAAASAAVAPATAATAAAAAVAGTSGEPLSLS